ncbi:glutathione S-transferase [Zychaea mexicana]|uniref:glutathione S-transferase n=1 Tax=Zychaea mexicana TaxID=64656 RepID=UPI0022FDEFDE|nr:glutathione S-transferase [Zychaea mexicana]KAI9497063.1 glutathione S-transferase [Zychaea mexicana]
MNLLHCTLAGERDRSICLKYFLSIVTKKIDELVLYDAAVCPFCHRAAIAFKETGLKYKRVEIDLANKPSWFKDVIPDAKVPALAIQGTIISESLVLIELANDLQPEKGLLPRDPVKRAQIRFAIEYFSSKVSSVWYNFLMHEFKKENLAKCIEGLEAGYTRINELLLEQAPSGPYFLGSEYSLADIAIAPIVARQAAGFKAFLNGLEIEAVKKYPRLQEWLEGIVSRPTFKETYPGDEIVINFYKKEWNVSSLLD